MVRKEDVALGVAIGAAAVGGILLAKKVVGAPQAPATLKVTAKPLGSKTIRVTVETDVIAGTPPFNADLYINFWLGGQLVHTEHITWSSESEPPYTNIQQYDWTEAQPGNTYDIQVIEDLCNPIECVELTAETSVEVPGEAPQATLTVTATVVS